MYMDILDMYMYTYAYMQAYVYTHAYAYIHIQIYTHACTYAGCVFKQLDGIHRFKFRLSHTCICICALDVQVYMVSCVY